MQNPRELFFNADVCFFYAGTEHLGNIDRRPKAIIIYQPINFLPCSVEPSDERPSPFVVNIPLIFLFRRVRHRGLMNGTPRLCHRYFLKSRRLRNKELQCLDYSSCELPELQYRPSVYALFVVCIEIRFTNYFQNEIKVDQHFNIKIYHISILQLKKIVLSFVRVKLQY